MTRPATNHTAEATPGSRSTSSPLRRPVTARHVELLQSAPSVRPHGEIRKRGPGARVPGCGPFKGRFRLRARARRTTHHWIRRVEAAAKQGHDAQVGALLRAPPPLPPHHSPRSRQVPATGSLCFPFSSFFLFYLILRHYGEFT